MTNTILNHFPLPEIRTSQRSVLTAIEKAFKDGYKNILLEAPVGSGKSAMAVTAAKYFGEAHLLTPMKSLQDQYYDDFHKSGLELMKGRNAYSCNVLDKGQTCAEGPCILNRKIKVELCTNKAGDSTCPYDKALIKAQDSSYVVHNLHSFIFQAYYADRFPPRRLLVIDECHKIEEIIRDFASKKLNIPTFIKEEDRPGKEDLPLLEDWVDWLTKFATLYSDRKDRLGVSARDRYLSSLELLNGLSDKIGKDFVISLTSDSWSKMTQLEFIPNRVGDLANRLLFDFGDKRIFMSGTIYNKEVFCKTLGLPETETCFIRIGSSFPLETRPIYMRKKYMVDTSHKKWDENYNKLLGIISTVSEVFDDVKGLIHTPSYKASEDLYRSLFPNNKRFIKHGPEDFAKVLNEFYESEEPKILLSPVCQQGVDFKYDRARFQLILRVPYLNTSSAFVADKVKNDYPWYNHQALVIFGQQIGRVNRAEDDFGATILVDERFEKFISKNRRLLPDWVMKSILV